MILEDRRDTKHQARAVIVAIAAFLLVMEVYLVNRPVEGLPQTPLQADSFLTDALAKGYRVSQTMKIEAEGFDGILLRASLVGDTHLGEMALALYEVETVENSGEEQFSGEERFLYRDVVPVRAVLNEPTFIFKFPVIDESAGRWYRLEILMANTNSQNEIELWATPGRWSGGGSMFVNDESAYAELVFETRASDRATVWARVRHHISGVGLIALLVLAVCTHAAFFMILPIVMRFSLLRTR